jgi:hypothetical protein
MSVIFMVFALVVEGNLQAAPHALQAGSSRCMAGAPIEGTTICNYFSMEETNEPEDSENW